MKRGEAAVLLTLVLVLGAAPSTAAAGTIRVAPGAAVAALASAGRATRSFSRPASTAVPS